jgi:hypothetical protein
MRPLGSLDIVPIADHPELKALIPAMVPWIIKGCEESGEFSPGNIQKGVEENKMQLWACVDTTTKPWTVCGAGVTRIKKLQDGTLRGEDVIFSADDADRFLPCRDRLKDYFRSQGCKTWRLHGRKGWLRKLPEMKWVGIVLEENLSDGADEPCPATIKTPAQ